METGRGCSGTLNLSSGVRPCGLVADSAKEPSHVTQPSHAIQPINTAVHRLQKAAVVVSVVAPRIPGSPGALTGRPCSWRAGHRLRRRWSIAVRGKAVPAPGKNGSGRGPDAGRTIDFKGTGADRTRAWPFLPAPRTLAKVLQQVPAGPRRGSGDTG
eukprot:gene12578-biopygen4951